MGTLLGKSDLSVVCSGMSFSGQSRSMTVHSTGGPPPEHHPTRSTIAHHILVTYPRGATQHRPPHPPYFALCTSSSYTQLRSSLARVQDPPRKTAEGGAVPEVDLLLLVASSPPLQAGKSRAPEVMACTQTSVTIESYDDNTTRPRPGNRTVSEPVHRRRRHSFHHLRKRSSGSIEQDSTLLKVCMPPALASARPCSGTDVSPPG